MPAVGQLVDNTSIPADPFSPDVTHHLCTFSDGAKLLVYSRTTGTYYALRNSSGVWQAPVSLTTTPLTGYNCNTIAQNGDTLTVWYIATSSTVTVLSLAYATGAVTVSTGTCGINIAATAIDVTWNSTTGYWYLASFGPWPFGGYLVNVSTFSSTLAAGSNKNVTNNTLTSISRLHIAAAAPTSGTVYLSYGDNAAGQTSVIPITPSAGGAFTAGTVETAYHTSCEHAVEFDVNGNLDLLIYDPAVNALLAVKRTGTSTYAAAVTLYSAPAIGTSIPATAYNNSTGALSVFFETAANQANDELYLAQRTGGSWNTATLAVGGDGNGYHAATTGRYVDGVNRDLVYVYGAAGSYAIYHFQLGTGSAPNTPVMTSPTAGNGGSTSPASSFNYSNPIPGDLQGAYELLYTRFSDNVVMWDSGWVASAASSGIAYAGTALVYGIQYQAQVRVKDAQLGSASAYSTAIVFTATRPGVATITNVLDNGVNVVAGGDITSAIATLTYSWSQPDGNTNTQYQILLYADDGVTLVNSTGVATFVTPIASGSSVTLNSWTITDGANPQISNLTWYRFQIRVIDSQGGVTLSPQYRVRTNWTPPATPFDIGISPNSNTGVVTLSWVNASAVASVNVYMRPTGTTAWQQLPLTTALPTSVHAFSPPGVAFDYGFQSVGSTGILSAIITYRNVTLPLKFGYYTIWLNDTTNPLSISVALGLYADQPSSVGWQHVENEVSFVAQGGSLLISDFDLTDYWVLQGRRFFLLARDGVGTGAVTALQTLATLEGWSSSHTPLLYRDTKGRVMYVLLKKLQVAEADDGVNRIATCNLEQTNTNLTVLVA